MNDELRDRLDELEAEVLEPEEDPPEDVAELVDEIIEGL